MGIVKLSPAFKDYLWGGEKLKTKYNKQTNLRPLAESWELSTHPDGQSTVVTGKYAGCTFSEYLAGIGKPAWGTNAQEFEDFPVLIKFIDAKQSLSIQVHPSDEYALRVEHEYGKTEMWYILDCEIGAYLYFGVAHEITKEEFGKAIEDDTLCGLLKRVPVKKGDVFFIPAGTVHAIGAGIMICEIQQNSNSTYRVYDFGRRDKQGNLRELHIDKALAVSNLQPSERSVSGKKWMDGCGAAHTALASCPYFTTELITSTGQAVVHAGEESFVSLVILEGAGTAACGDDRIDFLAGDSLFVPASSGKVTVMSECALIKTTV